MIPFAVAPGMRAFRITVGLAAATGSVIDIGLIGPGPTTRFTPAFRGWSGSERTIVDIGQTAATPGYLPGVAPGRWHAVLGAYRIAETGAVVDVEIEPLPDEPASGVVRQPTRLPATPWRARRARRRRWLRCDLHAHSEHSDGDASPLVVARRGREAGLDALFLTDHNTESHLPFLAEAGARAGIAVLPGVEVTTLGGHFNALGVERWIEFRHRTPKDVDEAISLIHALGGIASVNHAFSKEDRWIHGASPGFDAIEIWNGCWRDGNEAALAWWDALLRGGRQAVAVGGSDAHSPAPEDQPLGTPVTWIRAADPTVPAVVDAIRAGQVVLTRDAMLLPPVLRLHRDTPTSRLVASWRLARALGLAADEIVVVTDEGIVARRRASAAGDRLDLSPATRYVRLEVRDASGEALAITNPVYAKEP